ncbi:MAG: hypothetical protein R2712_12790 [Vicinamibacterales bacterium]
MPLSMLSTCTIPKLSVRLTLGSTETSLAANASASSCGLSSPVNTTGGSPRRAGVRAPAVRPFSDDQRLIAGDEQLTGPTRWLTSGSASSR